jgi:uncharacterized protein YfaP (DUF2135 family)
MWMVSSWRIAALSAVLVAVVACGGRASLEGTDPGSGGEPGLGGAVAVGGAGLGGAPGAGGTVGVAGRGGDAGGVGFGGNGVMPGPGGSVGQGGVGGTPSLEYGTLGGRVVDADDDEPLDDVEISFFSVNGMLLETTDSVMGAYRAELPAGRVFATYALEGYLPASAEFEVVAGMHTEVSVMRLVPVGEGATGVLTGIVRDAETVEPIAGARLRLRAGVNADQGPVVAQGDSDANGEYVFFDLPAGNYTVEGSADGYARSYVDAIVIADEQAAAPDLLLSRVLDGGQLRIVLTWGARPADLDAHLHVPPIDVDGFEGGFEVSYGQRGLLDAPPYAELDVDDTSSYGPETISISRLVNGTYHYVVHRFSEEAPLSESEAQVSVFDESGRVQTAFVPTIGSGDYWHVFDIDGESSTITLINERVGSDPF